MSDFGAPAASGVSPPDRTINGDQRRARSAIALGTVAVLVFAIGGAMMLPAIDKYRLWWGSALYAQFAAMEPMWLGGSIVFAAVVLALASRSQKEPVEPARAVLAGSRAHAMPIAIAVLAATIIGTYVIFHGFYFADDEYSAWVQAAIFAAGKTTATLPPTWCTWITALTPTSINAVGCQWSLSFLPIHSLIRSAFIALHVDHLAGPTIAALSILLLADTARRLWPTRPDRTIIAVATLAVSTQFLVMSMTMWAMPTHLLFSIAWLWLFVKDRTWSVVLLPWVGVAALGVHSPLPHAFWVAGLLVRYPWERRWRATFYIAAVYVLGVMFWLQWLSHTPTALASLSASGPSFASPTSTLQTVGSIFHAPDLLYRVTMLMHLGLLQTWNTPVALLCAVASIVMWERLQVEMRYVALSFVLMLVARAVYPENQGEGWGYRYAYTGLANLALLTAVGADVLRDAVGSRATTHILVASLAFSIVELPLRGIQVESIVRPYWQASEMMAHSPGEVIVYPWHRVMWGRQILRNDPFMRNKPKIMGLYELSPANMALLLRTFPGKVRFIQPGELQRLGLPMEPSIDSLRKLVQ